METVTGIFRTREDAERAAARIRGDVHLLLPGSQAVHSVPTTGTEQPGLGMAIGGVVGGALGIAGATMLLPAVGTVIAVGIAGAALLGAGAAAIGDSIESGIFRGIPADEVYVYEDALRQGKAVLIASTEHAEQARAAMSEAGAETIDAARESWWLGLRDDERVHYEPHDEAIFRRGFEAAQDPQVRGTPYEEARGYLHGLHAEVDHPAFRAGYARGLSYYQDLQRKYSQ